MKKSNVIQALFILLLLGVCRSLHGNQVPSLINFQGRILVGNAAFNGTGNFKFAILEEGSSPLLWSNSSDADNNNEPDQAISLPLSRGLYAVILGDTNISGMAAIPSGIFTNGSLFVRVWFNDGNHGFQKLEPDQRITSVGYALMAANVPDLSITASKLAPGILSVTNLSGVLASTQIPALDAAKISSGTINDNRLSANVALLGGVNIFSGINVLTNEANYFSGDGSGLINLAPASINGTFAAGQIPNLNASKITSGTLNDNRLSTNVARLNGSNNFSNPDNQFIGNFIGNAASLTNLGAANIISGTLADERLSANVALLGGSNSFSGINVLTNESNYFAGDGSGLINLAPASINGTLVATQIPSLDASKITSGTFASGQIPNLSAAKITGGTLNDNRLSANVAFKVPDLSGLSNSIQSQIQDTNAALAATIANLAATVQALSAQILLVSNQVSSLPPGVAAASPYAGDTNLTSRGFVSFMTVPASAWEDGNPTNSPSARSGHSAVWTGNEMVIWGGRIGGAVYSGTGAIYDDGQNSWQAVTGLNAPDARTGHTAIWTGTEMIVWGGFNLTGYLSTGGRWQRSPQTWTALPAFSSPEARDGHVGIWTGSKLLVWGGKNSGGILSSGYLYDPANNSWEILNLPGEPEARFGASAVMADNQIIIWGGIGEAGHFNNGKRLLLDGTGNPTAWLAMDSMDAPIGRTQHSSIWTGDRMLVWGGANASGALSGGAAYDPVEDTWAIISTANQPSARFGHVSLWTGSEMLIFGGEASSTALASGGAFNPVLNQWRVLSSSGNPTARSGGQSAWTGNEMLVFGGLNGDSPVSALERLIPQPEWHFYRKP